MSRVSDGHEYDRKNRASASERQAHFIVPGARYIYIGLLGLRAQRADWS